MEAGEASLLAPSVPASYATVARIGLGGTPPNMILCRWYNYTFFATCDLNCYNLVLPAPPSISTS